MQKQDNNDQFEFPEDHSSPPEEKMDGGIKTKGRIGSCCSVPNGGLHLIMAAGLEENGCFGEIQKGRND